MYCFVFVCFVWLRFVACVYVDLCVYVFMVFALIVSVLCLRWVVRVCVCVRDVTIQG